MRHPGDSCDRLFLACWYAARLQGPTAFGSRDPRAKRVVNLPRRCSFPIMQKLIIYFFLKEKNYKYIINIFFCVINLIIRINYNYY